MSASREKQARKNTDFAPKTAREAQQRKEEQRTRLIYGAIGAALAVVVIASIIWNSNIISRSATAVTVDGEKYTAAQVNFYYRNAYVSFVNGWSYFLSYFGLDTSTPLANQTLSETAASFLDAEEGITWQEYFMEQGLNELASVQNGLRLAEEENFVFPDSVQEDLNTSMETLTATARGAGYSVSRYLQNTFGSTMTERTYRTELLHLLQLEAYSQAYQDGLTYTQEELQDAYEENADNYDHVSYEMVRVDGSPVEEEEAADEDSTDAEEANILDEDTVDAEEAVSSDGSVDSVDAEEETVSSGENSAETEEADTESADGTDTAEADANSADSAEAEEADTESADSADAEDAIASDGSADSAEASDETGEEDASQEEEETNIYLQQARESAELILEAYQTVSSSGQDMTLQQLSATATNATYSEMADDTYDDLTYTSEAVRDWLYDADRQDGDATILEEGDYVYVLVFHDRFRDEENTVNVRHILITPDDGTIAEGEEGHEEEEAELLEAAHKLAEDILTEWQEGEATEDSFAALADKYSDSADGVENGGLYTQLAHTDSLNANVMEWCFEIPHESGDTEIIESSNGYEILYFVSDDIPTWAKAVQDTLTTEDYTAWSESLYEDADITREDFGMRFVL